MTQISKHKNACALLWTHAAIDMNGEVLPCCRFRRMDYTAPNIQDGLANAVNGEMFSDIRKRMLAGERLENCFKCWEQEKNTGISMRTDYSKKYADYIENKPKSKYLEIGFSTHCNLACRMCGPEYSSKWSNIKDPKQSVKMGFDLNTDWFDMDLSELDEIKVIGGEPMMATQHDDFVEKLIQQHYNLDKLRISYHTNATVLPKKRIVEFWQQLGEVRVYFSLDGVGKVNEYQRPGHDWETILKNIEEYKTYSGNIILGTHTTVTALNIMHINDFLLWREKILGTDRLTLDTAEQPYHLCISNMSEEMKQRAITACEQIKNEEIKNRLIKKINQPAEQVYTKLDIQQQEKELDTYFKQESII